MSQFLDGMIKEMLVTTRSKRYLKTLSWKLIRQQQFHIIPSDKYHPDLTKLFWELEMWCVRFILKKFQRTPTSLLLEQGLGMKVKSDLLKDGLYHFLSSVIKRMSNWQDHLN